MKYFVLFFLLLFSGCSAQTSIKAIPNKTDSLHISWKHPWTDVKNKTEHVLYFDICLIDEQHNVLYVSQTPHDSASFRPQLFHTFYGLCEGTYYAKVVAVDLCGNRSSPHFSSDPTAKYGGWYSIIDFTAPKVSFEISP